MKAVKVYKITIKGVIRYYGITDDIKRRTYQHNNLLKKGHKKELYDNIRKLTDFNEIELEVIRSFETKTEARRYEALMILTDHFKAKKLWQSVPSISDKQF